MTRSYEFGVKVTIATTRKQGLVGCRSMPGNSYDGHALAETIEQPITIRK